MIRGIVSLLAFGTLVLAASCNSDPAEASVGPDASIIPDDDDPPPGTDAGRADASGSSSGSGSSGSSGASGSGGTPEGGTVVDYSVAGPNQTATESGTTDDPACDVAYVRYKPTQGTAVATVVLAHGFAGNVGDLEGLAEHLASWGLDVVATTLCTNNIGNVDHPKNGKALADLAAKLQLPAPLFAGFSAGGLAAYLAAGTTANAAGFVGLDPVDADEIAVGAAPIAPSVRVILTEPAQCNSRNNFKAVLTEQANAEALRVTGASHYDALGASCTGLSFGCRLCGPTGADHHRTMLTFATAALLELAGTTAAAGYFTPGAQPYDERLAAGTISAP